MKLEVNLTPREQEFLPYLLKGLSNKEIGAELGISAFTARNMAKRICYKHGVSRKLELLSKYLVKKTEKSTLPQGA